MQELSAQVIEVLAQANGVRLGEGRAAAFAKALAPTLAGSCVAASRLAFEDEPATYVAALVRGAVEP